MFETGRVLMKRGWFETDADGEMLLRYPDRASWGWSNPLDFESRVDVLRALKRLQRNKFIAFTHASGEFRIRLAERAKAARASKATTKTTKRKGGRK
jgi:hypothetical protein